MLETLRVGIVGAGLAGTGHAYAFSGLPGVRVCALWSRSRARAEMLAARLRWPGLQVYDHWQDLVEQAEIDVLSLATPPASRREPFVVALERGRHVLVEKPLSTGLADAQAMAQAAGQADAVTAVSFNWRYAPGCQLAWRAVREGRIGAVCDIRTEWRFRATTPAAFATRPWATRLDIGDGTLGENISHEFDKARFLSGCEFARIVSRIAPRSLGEEPGLAIEAGFHVHLAELSGGVVGDFRFTVTPGEEEWSLTLGGERGTVRASVDAAVCQSIDDPAPVALEVAEGEGRPGIVTPLQHTWNRLIGDFVAAVRRSDRGHKSVPLLPSLADGLAVQRVIAAARRSGEEQRWVGMDEVS